MFTYLFLLPGCLPTWLDADQVMMTPHPLCPAEHRRRGLRTWVFEISVLPGVTVSCSCLTLTSAPGSSVGRHCTALVILPPSGFMGAWGLVRFKAHDDNKDAHSTGLGPQLQASRDTPSGTERHWVRTEWAGPHLAPWGPA